MKSQMHKQRKRFRLKFPAQIVNLENVAKIQNVCILVYFLSRLVQN